mmetsp:Transcript_15388/g.22861  ORF Transcript_15388/g.22861 Transcript_15388/m.22861 type:complete len:260 (+) Transcript_15388:81-860(+)
MDDWYTKSGDSNAYNHNSTQRISGADMGGGYAGMGFNQPSYPINNHPNNGRFPTPAYAGGSIGPAGSFKVNTPFNQPIGVSYGGLGKFDNEPPLLEELGINFEHIWAKTKTVMIPMRKIDDTYLDETDLAGPLVFALIFGTCLLFTGKIHFGYIYGFGAFGCVSLNLVLNLMGDRSIDGWRTCSVLGYCLLPLVILSGISILLDLRGNFGMGLTAFSVIWSCTAATKLFEQCLDMRRQRWLIAYPIGLLYSSFALMTVF